MEKGRPGESNWISFLFPTLGISTGTGHLNHHRHWESPRSTHKNPLLAHYSYQRHHHMFNIYALLHKLNVCPNLALCSFVEATLPKIAGGPIYPPFHPQLSISDNQTRAMFGSKSNNSPGFGLIIGAFGLRACLQPVQGR